MARYCIDEQPLRNGEHMIHIMDCKRLPDVSRCSMLGEFDDFAKARTEAIKRFEHVNACLLCLPLHYQPK